MNLIKILRKPYLSVFMAFAVLFVSCQQYDAPEEIQKIENKFDYTFYEQNKDSPVFEDIIKDINKKKTEFNKNSTLSKNKKVLKVVNTNFSSNLELPDSVLKLTNYDHDEILNISLKNKWINQIDVTLIKSFKEDFKLEGFEKAIDKYENTVLKMNLSVEEFTKKNTYLNTIKLYNYQKQKTLNKNIMNKGAAVSGGWDCFFAILGVAASGVGVTSCVTVVLCGVALVGYLLAARNFIKHCVVGLR